jgi:putative aminopeptidase FrvX
MQDLLDLIERLVTVPGPSGFEDAVCLAIKEEIDELPGETSVDALGNLVLRLPADADAPSLMFMAHMDQIGFVVKYVDNDGSLYFERSGLVDERTILASLVDIWTDQGPQTGVIGVRSRHLVSEQELGRAVRIDDLWVDVGARSAEEVAERGIEIGQPATLRGKIVRLNDHFVAGPSIDNRAGCATLVALARAAADRPSDVELIFVWSTQEEVGARGAKVAAQWIQPTLAIVVDTLPAGDPSTPARHATTRVGAGPVVRAVDNRGSIGTIYSVPMKRRLLELARTQGIPHQIDVFPTWTDACEVHLAGRGVPTGGVFIPRLCSHSPNEILDVRDVEQTVALLDAFAQLDAETARTLATRPAFPLVESARSKGGTGNE